MSSVAVWEPASGREANAYRLNRIRDHPNASLPSRTIQHRKDAEPTLAQEDRNVSVAIAR